MIDTNDNTIDQMRTIMEAAASITGKNWLCVQIAFSPVYFWPTEIEKEIK